MSRIGDTELLVRARTALLDALEALAGYRDAVVVIGAQAIYLHTDRAAVALAEATKDSDLAMNPRNLPSQPLLEDVMTAAGFELDAASQQPGTWIKDGIPVDLMVPEALAGQGGRRGVRIPPHSKHSMRRAVGLEAAVVDYHPISVAALTSDDQRVFSANVASPAALLVAKLHKLGERERQRQTDRLSDKDAHDVYRLLITLPVAGFTDSLNRLRSDELAGEVTEKASGYLHHLFAEGPDAVGSMMAGRAEEGIGDPDVVSATVAALAQDLLTELHDYAPTVP